MSTISALLFTTAPTYRSTPDNVLIARSEIVVSEFEVLARPSPYSYMDWEEAEDREKADWEELMNWEFSKRL